MSHIEPDWQGLDWPIDTSDEETAGLDLPWWDDLFEEDGTLIEHEPIIDVD